MFVIWLGREFPSFSGVNVKSRQVIRLVSLFNIKLGGIDVFDLFPELLIVEHNQIVDISET